MTQLAVGYKDRANGREQLSDGRMSHRGLLEVNGFRAGALGPSNIAVSPINGRGLEIGYHRDSGAGSALGYIYCLNRDSGLYEDLAIQCRNIAIFPQGGGSFQLPANAIDGSALKNGTVDTPQLAANAAQKVLGLYQAAPSWSTTVNAWLVTPITVTITTTGGQLRVEWMTTMAQSLAQGQWLTGLGTDGTVSWGTSYSVSPAAGNPVTVCGVWYLTLAAGIHTVSIFVYNVSAGSTLSIYTGAYSALYVTEQKR